MKLLFYTSNPSNLKSEIISLIESGDKKTWEIHESKNIKYLKHTQQWGDKGVIELTYNAVKKQLIAEVRKFSNVEESVTDFEGYYLGRFCEMIFVDFPDKFTMIEKE